MSYIKPRKYRSGHDIDSLSILATIDLTSFHLDRVKIGFIEFDTTSIIKFLISFFQLFKTTKYYNAVLFSSSNFYTLLALPIHKILRPRTQLFMFDLILKRPNSSIERILANFKGWMLRFAEGFLMINKYWDGYKKYYGLQTEKCHYIPFKPNNYNIYHEFKTHNKGYVLCCGSSQRDIDTLIQAAATTKTLFKILLPTTFVQVHNARYTNTDLPGNIEIISNYLDKRAWYRFMADCFCVVIPIIEDTLQPAGISVYLEAMLFRKPVIITAGSSTIGLLDDSLAMIVAPKSPSAIAKALKNLETDKSLYKRLADNGFRYAKQLQGHERMMLDVVTVLSQQIDKRITLLERKP